MGRGAGTPRPDTFGPSPLSNGSAVTRRRGVGLAVALLIASAGCTAQATPSTGQPSGGGATANWQGSDLLWDALGTTAGFTAVGNSGVVVTSSDGADWTKQPAATHQTLRGISSDGATTLAVGTGAWSSRGRPAIRDGPSCTRPAR